MDWVRLSLVAVLAALSVSASAFSAPANEIFGPHRIEPAARAHSYVLHVVAADGASGTVGAITLRCIADEQALVLSVRAPRADTLFAARQTITVWSDKTPATDITLSGDPSGAFAVSAMNEQAGLEADAAFMTLFETLIGAEEHVSYSVGADVVTIDAAHLNAARTRFAALCARPADAGEEAK